MDEKLKKGVMNSDIIELQKRFGNSLILNEKLSKYSWFKLGGTADVFFRPKDKNQLCDFLSKANKLFDKIYVLGAGSNTLFRDGGVRGLTIKLSSNFSYLKLLDNNEIEVGGATLDKQVSNFACEKGIGNLEFLACIPGSIGGSVIMNSGCYKKEISNIFVSMEVIDFKGNEKTITKDQLEFYYRGTNLDKNLIIISVRLKGTKSSTKVALEEQKILIEKKKVSQPSKVKTCGSTFKNPKEKKAWQLIKEIDPKDLKVGGASISSKHCNFFINDGEATSEDIEKLIEKVKQKVFDKSGVNLDLEIKLIGEKL